MFSIFGKVYYSARDLDKIITEKLDALDEISRLKRTIRDLEDRIKEGTAQNQRLINSRNEDGRLRVDSINKIIELQGEVKALQVENLSLKGQLAAKTKTQFKRGNVPWNKKDK